DSELEGVLADYFRTAYRRGTPWCGSSIAVKREALLAVGGFPTGVHVGADFLAWARLASVFPIAISPSRHAIVHLRGAYPSRPIRLPDVPDVVGEELARMVTAASAETRPSLRRYAAVWHRVRATMLIYHGHRAGALGELRTALRYAPGDPRLYAAA